MGNGTVTRLQCTCRAGGRLLAGGGEAALVGHLARLLHIALRHHGVHRHFSTGPESSKMHLGLCKL